MSMVTPSSTVRRFVTKSEYMYEALRQDIQHLRLRPGSTLRIDELAETHGVSPIPVREAVARLTAERFIVTRPHIGPQVAPIDESAVRDVFALLSGLESAATARVVLNVTPADVDELHALVVHMDGSTSADVWTADNTQFHMRLAAIAGLPLVEDSLRLGFAHWERIRRHFFGQDGNARKASAQEDHRRMLALLEARDTAGLDAVLRQHNASALASYKDMLAGRTEVG